jgi:uncharacterized Zn finger protein (UPF0148 family)
MLKDVAGYFCPVCRFGHEDDKETQEIKEKERLEKERREHERLERARLERERKEREEKELGPFMVFINAIKKGDYNTFRTMLENPDFDPSQKNNMAMIVARSVGNSYFPERLAMHPKMNRFAY